MSGTGGTRDSGEYEVAVVGAGPAGAAAAIELARRGRSVILLERRQRIRKLCGEFLSSDGVHALAGLGVLDRVEAAGPARISRFVVRGRSGSVRGTLPAEGLGVSRTLLEPLLRERAAASGADLRVGTAVRSVEGVPGRFTVTLASGERLCVSAVVGATGRSARVSGLTPGLEPRDAPDRTEYVAMKAHFRGWHPGDAVHLFVLDGGYVGASAVEDALNVCFIARRGAFRRAGASAEAFLERGARYNPGWRSVWKTAARLAEDWYAVGAMSYRTRRPVRNGCLLVGDAAGQVGPVLGLGQSMALQSGMLAARTLDDALARHDPVSGARCYAAAWHTSFARRLQVGRALNRVLVSRFASAGVRLAGSLPGLGEALVRGTRSDQAALGIS